MSPKLVAPQLSEDIASLPEEEQVEAHELFRRRLLFFGYRVLNSHFNQLHIAALRDPLLLGRQMLVDRAGREWAGNLMTLKGAVIRTSQFWQHLPDVADIKCPVQFDQAERGQFADDEDGWLKMSITVEHWRRRICNMNEEGWVRNEEYEEAKKKLADVKEEIRLHAEVIPFRTWSERLTELSQFLQRCRPASTRLVPSPPLPTPAHRRHRRQLTMLRASLLRARPAIRPIAPAARPQWRVAQRFYADDKKNLSETALPNPAPLTTPSNPAPDASSTLPPSDIPKPPPTLNKLAPPSRSAPVVQPATTPPTGPGTASVAPDPKPPKPKRRRLRRLFQLLILSALGYAGGVWYSLVSDNFHDFFTEYVPWGEESVGYFEEREFRRRFPGRAGQPRLHPQVTGEHKVTIPGNSGLTSRVAKDSDDLAAKGPHVSAVRDNSSPAPSSSPAAQAPKIGSKTSTPTTDKRNPQDRKKQEEKKAETTESTSTKDGPPRNVADIEDPIKVIYVTPAPPPKPIAQIDNLNVPAAGEPVVQDVVKIINDIITAINSDEDHGNKYSPALDKAKSELGKVVSDINLLRENVTKSAEEKVQAAHSEFDEAAKELVRRLEMQMKDQETHWKEEYENERERLASTWKTKLQSELDTANKVHEQTLKNKLLEQSISLQKNFATSIRDHVETERDGRLGKLTELSSSVQELEKLTTEWNTVVDANLKTQHLVVAVEAVKSALDNQVVPKPFISELAALKEIASDDPVVSAAIASINPAAYQRGIPNAAQLIDRFRRVAQEVRKASLLPEDAGVASHLASLAMSKVLFKKSGITIGHDVEAVLARTEALLEEGDLDNAAREMNALHGWAKVLSKDWLGECRRVLEVKQALDVIAAEARLQSLLVD
ncbi:mitochondrial inner membrane protein-domain-containing protein [Massariosphaeria phaeospora]|uniref:MICOS complex subunit MIC60 n=1 Tax=Massariosphaeria phaeospora TaxID=100035 RepID=A0A7C8MXA0_9PLEO|nr:mitochondrial inner membrane protein-domain-containing protein [Massariosphaeria phaeospora]